MAKRRDAIPTKTEAVLLFLNDRTCCVCHDHSRGVQIHHIDSNPKNNDIRNLATLCPVHHDEVHKRGGATRGFSPTLVKKYKQNWERTVRERRPTAKHPRKGLPRRIERVLLEFEIRRLVYEILSLPDAQVNEIRTRLDFLHHIYIFEQGVTGYILEALNQVAVLPALGDERKSILIAQTIPEFFYHLPGPEYNAAGPDDRRNLAVAMNVLGTIGEFSAEFYRKPRILNTVLEALERLWEIAAQYFLRSTATELLRHVNRIRKAAQTKDEDGRRYEQGLHELEKFRKRLMRIAARFRRKWKVSSSFSPSSR